MISKLAKGQIETWRADGLEPSYDDIIRLNDLGLRVERGSDMFSFAAVPRMAFLGDRILREPTIARRIWLDTVQPIFADDLQSKIYLIAFVLGADELPSTFDPKRIKDAVEKYRDDALLGCTETQILAAIDWCLNGDKVQADDLESEAKKQVDSVYDVPCEDESLAKHLLLAAMSDGMPQAVADYALQDDLQRMVLLAAMQHGANDVLKNEHTKAAGRYYVASGKIHARLVKEKAEREAKDKEGEAK